MICPSCGKESMVNKPYGQICPRCGSVRAKQEELPLEQRPPEKLTEAELSARIAANAWKIETPGTKKPAQDERAEIIARAKEVRAKCAYGIMPYDINKELAQACFDALGALITELEREK